MTKYTPGTILEDREGDWWVVKYDDRIIGYNQPLDIFDSVEALEKRYGPLKVVEDTEMVTLQTRKDNRLLIRDNPIYESFIATVTVEVVDKSKNTSGEGFPLDAFSVYEEAFRVLLKKNADYGPRNIADSPGGPLNGLMVRMYDKMARLRNLVESGNDPENESLRDTLMDMANYSLIGMLVIDGKWPGGSND